MPLTWSVDSSEQFVTVVADGNVERAEVEAMLDALVATDSLSFCKLFDGVQGSTMMDAEDLMGIGVRLRDLQNSNRDLGPLAVAVLPEKVHIVARVLDVLAAADRPMQVFADTAAARQWLITVRGSMRSDSPS